MLLIYYEKYKIVLSLLNIITKIVMNYKKL